MLSQHLCAPPSHQPRTSHSSCQGSGKEVCPHPLSCWYVQMSARPCSALIHSDLLVPALPLVPRDGPSAGDALGSKISSKEWEERRSCSQHESFPLDLRAALGAEGKEPGFWGSNPSPTSCKSVSVGQSLSLSAVSSSPC